MKRKSIYTWYPKEFLTSMQVAEMSLEEECAYRRALDYFYLNGCLSANEEELAVIVGKKCTVKIALVVKQMFIESNGKLILKANDLPK